MKTVLSSLGWFLFLAELPLLFGQEPEPERKFDPIEVGNLAGTFDPITEVPVVIADKSNLEGNEMVLGVEIDGEPRAYPINMLTGPTREILNDTLGGRAIAATW